MIKTLPSWQKKLLLETSVNCEILGPGIKLHLYMTMKNLTLKKNL